MQVARELAEHKEALSRAELASAKANEDLTVQRLAWATERASLRAQAEAEHSRGTDMQAQLQAVRAELAAAHTRVAELAQQVAQQRKQVEAEQADRLEEIEQTWQQEQAAAQAATQATINQLRTDLATEQRKNNDVQQVIDRLRLIGQEKEATLQAANRDRERLEQELRRSRLAQQSEEAQRAEMARLHDQLDQERTHLRELIVKNETLDAACQRYGGGAQGAVARRRGLV